MMSNIVTEKKMMKTVLLYSFMVICLIVFNINHLNAQVSDTCNCATIDFESIPGDSVYEGLMVNAQYSDTLFLAFLAFPDVSRDTR